MDVQREELADLLRRLDQSPNLGSARLRACVLANRLALRDRDPCWTDVAETLACEDVLGASRSLRDALSEQLALAARARRAIAAGTSGIDAGDPEALSAGATA